MVRARLLAGAALALAGAAMMAGWALRLEAVVRVLPGFLMVFNTALGFALAGVALAAGALAPARRRALRTAAGVALLALGSLVLAQYVFGIRLAIDWPGLHAWMIDPGRNPHPGRMSPATSTGFVLCGLAFLLAPRVRGVAGASAVRALTAALAALGALALAGHLLGLDDVLEVYWLTQVSLPTALSFLLLALGLWLDWRGEPWNAWRLVGSEENRIALAGALVLAGAIALTGVAVFWLMFSQLERTLSANLAFALKNQRALVAASVAQAVKQTADVGDRPNIRRLYAAPSSNPADITHPAFLKTVAVSTLNSGFTAFAFYDAQGRELGRAGEFLANSELRIPLPRTPDGRDAELQWDGGFVLQVRSNVVHEGKRLGEVRGQHRLADLAGVMTEASRLGPSSEFGLCGLRAGKLHCAPTRFQPRVFDVPPVVAGNRLPMGYAMEGGTGVLKLTDYRGRRVLAAYTPLETLGVALVLKTDLADLYAPVRERLGWFLLTLLGACAGGGWLLRLRVLPVVRRVLRGEAQLRMALEASRLAVWDWDLSSGRILLSEQWSALLGGVPRAVETSGDAMARIAHPEDAAAVAEQVGAMLKGTASHYANDHRVRTDSGEWRWIRGRGRVVERARDGSALRAVGTIVDINERKVHELQLAHRAAHDVLTGLPNRSLFRDRLERAVLRGCRDGRLMAVMYLDVDQFKGINDKLGHAAGDLLLHEFARRLSACVRATDTVARFGGDEFAVILEGLGSREDGLRIAGNMVAAMRPAFALEGQDAAVSASAGIAFREAAAATGADELLKAADAALYAAKSAGRDRYCVAA